METNLISARLNLLPRSLSSSQEVEFGLVQTDMERKLAVLAQRDSRVLEQFEGEASEFGNQTLLLGGMTHNNAKALRSHQNWLRPQLLGLSTSAGMGDRIGIATPGHVRAMRTFQGKIAPIYAQQSIREMTRTGRSPQQVMDDATWGVFEEGWRGGFGADADHLKTTEDIDACLAAGFTFYTFDPGQYVESNIQTLNRGKITEMFDTIPVEIQPASTGLIGKTFPVSGNTVSFDEGLLRAAVLKYGIAVAHVAEMYNHLRHQAGDQHFEVEISMDETEQPTSPAEHIYIASELCRLGVKWVSFAPRFVGTFEKGVDYIGDVCAFKDNVAVHAAIARQFGPYKLSLHSGSDKFSIYSVFMEETGGMAHLKTAGTSYLEAMQTIAVLNTDLIKEIYRFALERFESDRLSYHTSAQIDRAPKPSEIKDWTGLLKQFDAREILHVTFGSVLTDKTSHGKRRFYDEIMSILQANREAYFGNLESHFKRHLEPFSNR
jgi:tagaturonate epimerase